MAAQLLPTNPDPTTATLHSEEVMMLEEKVQLLVGRGSRREEEGGGGRETSFCSLFQTPN